jgi:serine/threonine protein kinase
MKNLIGLTIGDRYHILEQLGEGGMAVIYKAQDTRLVRNVAIKIFRPYGELLQKNLKRFEREARSLAQLSHPHIVKILDYGEYDGFPFFVMEYLSAGTLKDDLERRNRTRSRYDWRNAITLIVPILSALDLAHKKGMIHRDVKPSNILLNQDGQPLLSDFGIAKILETKDDDIDMTGIGVGIGTPLYMAPEQGLGKADARSDLYSVGVILYEMLTGYVPYRSDTPLAVLLKKSSEPLPHPKQFVPDMPDELTEILVKSLAKLPEKRYQTAYEFNTALVDFLDNKSNMGNLNVAPVTDNSNDDLLTQKTKPSLATRNIFAPVRNFARNLFVGISSFFEGREKISTSIDKNKKNIESWKTDGTMTINMIAALEPHRRRKILKLINRDHELKIKDILVYYGGGRYLFHGFGRFGATSLIDLIIEKAHSDLKNSQSANQQGVVMAIRLELYHTDNPSKTLNAIVREFRLEASRGKYANTILKKLEKLHKNAFTEVSTSKVENSVSIKATPMPGLETSFSRKADKTVPSSNDMTESGIVDILSQFLDKAEEQKPGLLESIIEKTLNNANIPSRIIIVLDKINSIATFKTLQELRAFSDSRITFFAIVSNEDFIRWDQFAYQTINNLGFKSFYVPSVWEEEHGLIREMIRESLPDISIDTETENFIEHLAYVTRGAPGDVVRELVDPGYNSFSSGVPQLDIKQIRDKKLVEFNAHKQKFLTKNWSSILGENFLTVADADRARIGIYELLDWMTEQREFSLSDIKGYLPQQKVAISLSMPLQIEIVNRLITSMESNRLLSPVDNDKYRMNFTVLAKDEQIREDDTLPSL